MKLKHLKSYLLSRKSRSVLGSIVILVVATLVFSRLTTRSASAAWYNDLWGYRTKITLSGTTDTNKKVKLDIDTATLIAAGKMQADCGDSRFTDVGGAILRYYLDSAGGACNTSSTDYYILLPTISDPTTVYHYYGNPSAPNGTEAAQFSEATVSPTPASATEEKSPGPVLYYSMDQGTDNTC